MPKNEPQNTTAAQQAAIEAVKVRLSRTKTWGGLETDNIYRPNQGEELDYTEKLGDPGQYPFTRGISENGYRRKMWTLRNIVGYGAPEDTLEGIRSALESGTAGINVVPDALTQQCVDPDHPAFGVEVGSEGCSIACARDMERLTQDIDITQSGVAYHYGMLAYAVSAAVATKRSIPLNKMLGSSMPDHLSYTLSGWGQQVLPAKFSHKATLDCVEFATKNSPFWALAMPQAYDLRERGSTPWGEIALGMAIVNQAIQDLVARGMSVDDIAPSLAWVSTADIDFFEEVAKFRAVRRVWARTMKERFGAKNSRSMSIRMACHTAGKSLVYQQPLNNLSRVAIQSFAALCGGVQSLEACTFDEPISIPTPEARELATRTQQILAHEVGAARTIDPLGGSYYVEALTDEIEARALDMLAQIEEKGVINAVADGSLEKMMDEFNLAREHELASKERILVGVNDFIPGEEPQPKRFTFDRSNTNKHIARFIEMKKTRDNAALEAKLKELYQISTTDKNFHQTMIDAFVLDGSIGEVWGTVRLANGLSYDPFNVIQSPFEFN